MTKKTKIFYGWWNVLCAFISFALSHATIAVFSFGTFVQPLQAEFGWQRGEVAFALTVNNLTVLILSPLVGVLIDRYGTRRVLIPSLIALAAAVAAMALLSGSIWAFYLMYFIIPLAGMGTYPHPYSRVVVAWFKRHRGLALGIALAGIGAGAALIPLLVQAVISSYGWRFGYIVFGLLVLFVSLPLTYLFLRETPEEMGLTVDGDENGDEIGEEDKVELSHTGSVIKPGLTMVEVVRTRSFWLMLFSFFLSGIIMTGMFVHMVPMLIDRGLTPALAAYASAALGTSLIVGRVFSGYLMDRFFAPHVAAVFLAAMTLGVMIFASGTAGPFVFVGAAMVGLAMGSEMSEIAYIISRYFGLRAFGKIYGFIFSGFQLGGAIGAPVLGIYYDKMGNYVGILWILVGVGVVSTILIAMLGKYPSVTRTKYVQQTSAAAY